MNRVHGEGPIPARILILGEAAGPEEARSGRPFDDDRGRSGKLLTSYLTAAGIDRTAVYVDNRYPFWPGPGNPDPTPEQLETGDRLLAATLLHVKPAYILCLGRVAARYFHPGFTTMEEWHGRVLPGRSGPIVAVAYHPAAGLHQPSLSHHCPRDIAVFAAIVGGRLHPSDARPPADIYHHPDYHLVDGLPPPSDLPAVDTEGLPTAPVCLSISTTPGSGLVVLADDVRKANKAALYSGPILLHHGMWDFPVLRAMGVDTDRLHPRDTRIGAYLLCEAGQGLKELALRDCGMRMDTYEAVARPPSQVKVGAWLERALKKAKRFSPVEEVLVREDGKMRVKKPHGLATRLKVMRTGFTKDLEFDPWDRWSGFPVSYREEAERIVGKFPPLSLLNATEAEWVPYAGRDPDATRRLYFSQLPRLRARGLEGAFELDCAAMPMFEDMQRWGFKLDTGHLAHMRPPIVESLARREKAFSKKWLGGKPINLRSRDMVADFIYGELGCGIPKMTKSGARGSVDDAVLEILRLDALAAAQRPDPYPRRLMGKYTSAERAEALGDVMGYAKEATHLSFVDRLPKWMQEDGRLHPSILITRTVTGRPASKDPNLYNIPVRTKEGKELRNAFVSEPGYTLLSIDLSQIELRVFAHLSGEKRMVQAYHDGEDFHQMTSDELGITRSESKTVNFLILYGGGAWKLMTTLALAGNQKTEKECDAIIRGWYARFPGAAGFIKQMHLNARRDGYVRTLGGRMRYLPNARLPVGDPMREEAERFAQNTPIQGGAADIIKMAMVKIWKWIIANRGEGVRPLLQIYDDLIFEIPEGREDVGYLFKAKMTKGYKLRVPLDATVKLGKRWGEME